jgi:ABC-type nitrate/sulfonate/bicarbonate transport system substrate-binding protein
MTADSSTVFANNRRAPSIWRIICATEYLLVGALVIDAQQFAGAQERKKIVVAYVAASEQMIIPALAQQTGIFHKHGLDAQVVLVSGSPRNVQSLIAGNFDYTMAGVTPLVRARLNGADPAILAAIANYSTQQIIVAPQAGIRKLEDLRGKIVGVTQYGSEGDTFLRIALKSAGLRPDLDNETRDKLPALPMPMKQAIQSVLDRETDPKAKALQPSDVADIGFLQEIEKSGFLRELDKSAAR